MNLFAMLMRNMKHLYCIKIYIMHTGIAIWLSNVNKEIFIKCYKERDKLGYVKVHGICKVGVHAVVYNPSS